MLPSSADLDWKGRERLMWPEGERPAQQATVALWALSVREETLRGAMSQRVSIAIFGTREGEGVWCTT